MQYVIVMLVADGASGFLVRQCESLELGLSEMIRLSKSAEHIALFELKPGTVFQKQLMKISYGEMVWRDESIKEKVRTVIINGVNTCVQHE